MKPIPMQDVIDYYRINQPAGHWFDADTMRFFKTKLPDLAYETPAGVLFLTRETNPRGLTAYTVRRQVVNGDIETVGEFHAHPTKARGMRALKDAASA